MFVRRSLSCILTQMEGHRLGVPVQDTGVRWWSALTSKYTWVSLHCCVSVLDAHSVNGKLVIKRVSVPDLDERFSDMAETFNKQHEHYEAMVRRIKNVRQIYGCNNNSSLALTECVMKIREEHGKVYSESVKAACHYFHFVSFLWSPSRSPLQSLTEVKWLWFLPHCGSPGLCWG